MKHIGLFEGIGGFSLAARWMGWETIAWCEWNEFGQQVLKHYFPKAEGFGDITKTDFTKYANTVDIVTGGFPCQPYSVAGKRLGKEDNRHLWPEMLRAIREIQPCYVVGENVSGLTNWNGGMVFDEVQADLENEGYEVLPFLLPACAVNAPHRRDRIWFIAYSNGCRNNRTKGGKESVREQQNKKQSGNRGTMQIDRLSNERITANPECLGQSGQGQYKQPINTTEDRNGQTDWLNSTHEIYDWKDWPTQSPICSGNDGLPSELVGIAVSKHRQESIKAYGNAIVPQVAYQIFKAIALMEAEMLNVQPGDEVQCGVGKNNI